MHGTSRTKLSFSSSLRHIEKDQVDVMCLVHSCDIVDKIRKMGHSRSMWSGGLFIHLFRFSLDVIKQKWRHRNTYLSGEGAPPSSLLFSMTLASPWCWCCCLICARVLLQLYLHLKHFYTFPHSSSQWLVSMIYTSSSSHMRAGVWLYNHGEA